MKSRKSAPDVVYSPQLEKSAPGARSTCFDNFLSEVRKAFSRILLFSFFLFFFGRMRLTRHAEKRCNSYFSKFLDFNLDLISNDLILFDFQIFDLIFTEPPPPGRSRHAFPCRGHARASTRRVRRARQGSLRRRRGPAGAGHHAEEAGLEPRGGQGRVRAGRAELGPGACAGRSLVPVGFGRHGFESGCGCCARCCATARRRRGRPRRPTARGARRRRRLGPRPSRCRRSTAFRGARSRS